METKSRTWLVLTTAIAPIAWGSVYFVTRQLLPHEDPLWGGVLRALPAGIMLALIARKLPHGSWWWRSVVLGVLNVGGFFALIYIAGTRLATSLASVLMSASAAALLLFGWLLLRQRPRLAAVLGAATGLVGVCIMLGGDVGAIDWWGVAASVGAMLASSLGFVLTAKWGKDESPVTLASWQLVAGALMLLPVAIIVEGLPAPFTVPSVLGFTYVTLIATALAYVVWFAGLRGLPASTVGVIGLLNPVTGVLLGVLIAGEQFGAAQAIGITLVLIGVVIGTRAPREKLEHTPS